MWNQIGKLGTLGTRNTVGQRVALTQICIFDPVFLSVKNEGKGGSESIALPVVFFGKKTDGLCRKNGFNKNLPGWIQPSGDGGGQIFGEGERK